MKNVIAVIAKLNAAIVASLLLTPLLMGSPPQGSPNLRRGTVRPGPHNEVGKAAPAPNQYEFYTFVVSGNTFYSTLFGINNSRLGIGWYCTDPDGVNCPSFLWRDGVIDQEALAYPDPVDYFGDVNNRGVAFGTVGSLDLTHAAALKLSTHTWTLLPDIDGKNMNQAMRMNEAGMAVGQACGGDWITASDQCVGWTWDGSSYSFTTIPGTNFSWTGPLAINDRGQVAGAYKDDAGHQHAYLMDGSKMTILDVPGASDTYADDINNSGYVLLDADFAGSHQNYLWREGVLTPLPNYPDPSAAYTYAYGLNDRGDYCGRWYDENWEHSHAFVAFRKSPPK